MSATKGNNYATKEEADKLVIAITTRFTAGEYKELKSVASMYQLTVPKYLRLKALKTQ